MICLNVILHLMTPIVLYTRGYATQYYTSIGGLWLWWHISAARYEIAIVISLENFHDNSEFPGSFYQYNMVASFCHEIRDSYPDNFRELSR